MVNPQKINRATLLMILLHNLVFGKNVSHKIKGMQTTIPTKKSIIKPMTKTLKMTAPERPTGAKS